MSLLAPSADIGKPRLWWTYFQRMERSRDWRARFVDRWPDDMLALLQTAAIAPDPKRRTRKRALRPKECAPAMAPYLLPHGGKRCKVDVLTRNEFSMVPIDIDAAPLSVVAAREIIHAAFVNLNRAYVSWPTWSSRDNYASFRVFAPLSRPSTFAELIPVWWFLRRALHEAGLPAASAKVGEPTVDPRLQPSRLYYLPARPAPGLESSWGGITPELRWLDAPYL